MGKFQRECKFCGEPILMVRAKWGKWRPLDLPSRNAGRLWILHRCSEGKFSTKYAGYKDTTRGESRENGKNRIEKI